MRRLSNPRESVRFGAERCTQQCTRDERQAGLASLPSLLFFSVKKKKAARLISVPCLGGICFNAKYVGSIVAFQQGERGMEGVERRGQNHFF